MLIPGVALAAPYGNLLQAEAAADAAEQAGVELALDALLEAVVDAYKPPPAPKNHHALDLCSSSLIKERLTNLRDVGMHSNLRTADSLQLTAYSVQRTAYSLQRTAYSSSS